MEIFGEIFGKDLKTISEYKSADYIWKKEKADDNNHIYLYRAYDGDKRKNFCEMLIGKKFLNPDKSVSYIRPKAEDWGKYAWTLWGTDEQIEKRWQEKCRFSLSPEGQI